MFNPHPTPVAPLLVIGFLHRVADIFKGYFGEANEYTLKDNFVTVYQLVEEMMDNGFPLTTEPSILKEMILPPTVGTKLNSIISDTSTYGHILMFVFFCLRLIVRSILRDLSSAALCLNAPFFTTKKDLVDVAGQLAVVDPVAQVWDQALEERDLL